MSDGLPDLVLIIASAMSAEKHQVLMFVAARSCFAEAITTADVKTLLFPQNPGSSSHKVWLADSCAALSCCCVAAPGIGAVIMRVFNDASGPRTRLFGPVPGCVVLCLAVRYCACCAYRAQLCGTARNF